MLPNHVSEDELHLAVNKAALHFQTRFGHAHGSAEDFKQQCFVWALEVLPKYKPEAGPLAPFLFIHLRNQASNFVRARVCRSDAPCKRCHAGDPCDGGGVCRKYEMWAKRQKTKASLHAPVPTDAGEIEMHNAVAVEDSVAEEVETRELLDIIRAELAAELLPWWEKMRMGERIPAAKNAAVMAEVLEILDVYGVSREELGLNRSATR